MRQKLHGARRIDAGSAAAFDGPGQRRYGFSTMPEPKALESLLLSAFPGARVEVTDLTGTKDHFQALVVAPAFEGKTRIEQHQMVYAALGDLMRGDIHALALTTRAR
jgi:stress-induced morphogen